MRKLNGFYAIEVLNGRLNGSSKDVENVNSKFNNISYTKKIAGRSKVSSPCQKFAIKEYLIYVHDAESFEKVKDGKQVKSLMNPYSSEIDDIFGFMLADKTKISKEEYEQLDECKKSLFKKKKNVYESNTTRKRKARLQMNALINTSNRKVEYEWSVATSTTNSMPYQQEVYSGVHSTIFNLNISEVGKFVVSDTPCEFIDYNEEEAKLYNVRDLSNEERYERISNVLDGIEHLSISTNQANHSTDTKPKFVILADYSWGNNAFQGIMKENGLDIDMLKKHIDRDEKFRLSNIYIGIDKFFDDKYNEMDLAKELSEYDFVKVSSVREAFENYKKELKESLL